MNKGFDIKKLLPLYIGKKNGNLTLIDIFKDGNITKCKCICKCGKEIIFNFSLFKNKKKSSCGCSSRSLISNARSKDFTGNKFGRLTLIERLPKYKGKDTFYKCKCDCGNECIKRWNSIHRGNVQSCGCIKKETHITLNLVKFDKDYAYIYVKGLDKPAIIDIEDYDKVKNYHWNRTTLNYINSKIYTNGKVITIPLHRLIMGIEKENNKVIVDHIDGNPLNNSKSNLRICSQKENCWNRGLKSTNTSGVTGVRREHKGNTWHAEIMVNYNIINLGNYKDFNEAVKARKKAEIKYYGEYRRKN